MQSQSESRRWQRPARGGRGLWALGLAVALPLLIGAPAHAHNVDGKLGVGFEETLNGVGGRLGQTAPLVRAAGLSVRYYLGNIGLEAILGAGLHSPGSLHDASGNAVRTTTDPVLETTGFLSVGAVYNVFRAPSVNLALGARVLAGWSRLNALSQVATGKDDTLYSITAPWRLGLAFEVPLRVEFFFSPAFAVAAAVGPVLAFNGSEQNPLTGGRQSWDLELTRGDFSGGLGFSYYF